jgi:hypothetical protein
MTIRTAGSDDVSGIVALLNAAFAMEWDFINCDHVGAGDRAPTDSWSVPFVVDGDRRRPQRMYLSSAATVSLGMPAVKPDVQGRGSGADDGCGRTARRRARCD